MKWTVYTTEYRTTKKDVQGEELRTALMKKAVNTDLGVNNFYAQKIGELSDLSKEFNESKKVFKFDELTKTFVLEHNRERDELWNSDTVFRLTFYF